MNTYLSVGAAVSISSLIQALLDNTKKSPTFEHLANHLKQVIKGQ